MSKSIYYISMILVASCFCFFNRVDLATYFLTLGCFYTLHEDWVGK